MSDIARPPGGPGGRRFDVLRALQAADAPLSIMALADELGVHPNTVRFHLGTLLDDGRIELAESEHKGRGRPAMMFRAVQQMDRGGTRRYRLLAEILTIGMATDEDPSNKALAAGRAWGQRLQSLADAGDTAGNREPVGAEESIDHLVGLLDELGFEPERRESDRAEGAEEPEEPEEPEGAEGETQIGFRHCPFLELAESQTDVICPIHMGLMQGALESWDAPVKVDRLDAFVEPNLCLARFTAAAPGSRGNADGKGRKVRVEHSAAGPVRVEEATG